MAYPFPGEVSSCHVNEYLSKLLGVLPPIFPSLVVTLMITSDNFFQIPNRISLESLMSH